MAAAATIPIIGHCMEFTTVTDALRLINTMGGKAIQISLGDPAHRRLRSITTSDTHTTVQIIKKHGFYVVIHGKFLYNFCRPGPSIKWQLTLLEQELYEANKISCNVIIHQGKNIKDLDQTKEEAHKIYADNVSQVLINTKNLNNHIILENAARQGTECGYSLDDLYDIYTLIDPSVIHRISFCIDLCHIFVAGELDMRDYDKVVEWFNRFDKLIGFSKLKVIHFNDSDSKFDSHNDNHGSIGHGYIGSVSTKGLEYVCQLAYKHSIPLILETPSKYINTEIGQLIKWSTL